MVTVTLLAGLILGRPLVHVKGTLEQIRYRFFLATMDQFADEFDQGSVTHGVDYSAQGHVLFPAGRANRMYFFEHMVEGMEPDQPPWTHFRLRAFDLKNGKGRLFGTWTFGKGKTKLEKEAGTLARFICLDRPNCKLPLQPPAGLATILSRKEPMACYQYEALNGLKVSFVDAAGVEHDDTHVKNGFPMSKQEKRYLKRG